MEWTEGKKGNIRALLGTLHTVIWEGSGWNCNLSNLVTHADVKKAYRKACLAVHPDKVEILYKLLKIISVMVVFIKKVSDKI